MTEKKRGRPAGRTHTVPVRIWLTPEQHAAYEAAAAERGEKLAEWMRGACDVELARGRSQGS
jgi:hypothetical protein